jgi:hypothetical protein
MGRTRNCLFERGGEPELIAATYLSRDRTSSIIAAGIEMTAVRSPNPMVQIDGINKNDGPLALS